LIKDYTLDNEFKLYENINTLNGAEMEEGLKSYKVSLAVNH